MTQLLQARGWYGVFLRTELLEPTADGEEGLRQRARLHVQIRPLIGWTSAEGGFVGLYYNEARGRLDTAYKLTEHAVAGLPDWAHHANDHVGDVCQDETTTIRGLLIHNVVARAAAIYENRKQNFNEVQLTDEAIILLQQKRIPLPQFEKEKQAP